MDEPLLLSVKKAASALGIGKSKLYQLIKTKDIKPIRIGSRTLVPIPELNAFVERAITGAGGRDERG